MRYTETEAAKQAAREKRKALNTTREIDTKIGVVPPKGTGARTFVAQQTIDQIGRANILAVSGGRITFLYKGKTTRSTSLVGLEFPVDRDHSVRVFLAHDDTYTVQRLQGNEAVGTEEDLYFFNVGDAVYRAGMYHTTSFGKDVR